MSRRGSSMGCAVLNNGCPIAGMNVEPQWVETEACRPIIFELCNNGLTVQAYGGPAGSAMSVTTSLTRQMLEWIALRPRDYGEVMESWRTSCPRLSIWEDASLAGLIDYEAGTGKVTLSPAGQAFLSGSGAPSTGNSGP